MDREALIEAILDRELEMFLTVPVRHRASCQDDPEGFRTFRRAQFLVCSKDTLESYAHDLTNAAQQGHNLMTLKYARMDNLIPVLNTNPVIDEMVDIQLEWQKEMCIKYPHLMARGRPLEDNGYGYTSFKTYLRGELETYSDATLACLWKDMLERRRKGLNMTEEIYAHMVRGLGYSSLEDAEAAARQGR